MLRSQMKTILNTAGSSRWRSRANLIEKTNFAPVPARLAVNTLPWECGLCDTLLGRASPQGPGMPLPVPVPKRQIPRLLASWRR